VGEEEVSKHLSFKKAARFLFCSLIFRQICDAVERAANAVRWFNTTRLHFLFMHLLYLDDSGSVKNKGEEYIILGGISIFENQSYYLSKELDKIAQSIDPTNPSSVEFHASEIFSRKNWPWDKLTKEEATGVIKSVLKIIANSSNSTYAFACAVHKKSFPSEDPLHLAFEDLCQRFDIYLSKLFSEGERQKGLLILDDSSYETSLQKLARNFRTLGTQWGNIKHLADTPFFVNSKASRIVQIADHIAYSVFRRYNSGDTSYFDIIAHKFHQADGIVHGLAHKQRTTPNCMCLACTTRRYSKVSTISFPDS
jgi:hypothetical protein